VFENPGGELRRRVEATGSRHSAATTRATTSIDEDYCLERRLDEDRLADMKFNEEGSERRTAR
jgi:hypothetical protein